MNDRDRARRALEIAGSLLDLSPRTRAVRIEEVCGGDTSLRAEVESILAAEAHVKGFLGSSPVARALSESSEALDESGLGPEPLAPGQKLGEFIVEERIGFGGMGVIYRARQPALDRSVALKVLSPCLAAVPSARVRFRREARAAARLRHDRIVSVHTVGEDGEVCYYAMDLIHGASTACSRSAAFPTSTPRPAGRRTPRRPSTTPIPSAWSTAMSSLPTSSSATTASSASPTSASRGSARSPA